MKGYLLSHDKPASSNRNLISVSVVLHVRVVAIVHSHYCVPYPCDFSMSQLSTPSLLFFYVLSFSSVMHENIFPPPVLPLYSLFYKL